MYSYHDIMICYSKKIFEISLKVIRWQLPIRWENEMFFYLQHEKKLKKLVHTPENPMNVRNCHPIHFQPLTSKNLPN